MMSNAYTVPSDEAQAPKEKFEKEIDVSSPRIQASTKMMFLKELKRDKELSPAAFCIAFVLADYCNTEKRYAFLGVKRLASEAGVSKSTAVSAIKQLEARGWFSVERSKDGENGQNANNHYRPNWSRLPAGDVAGKVVRLADHVGRKLHQGGPKSGPGGGPKSGPGGGPKSGPGGGPKSGPYTVESQSVEIQTEKETLSPLSPKEASERVPSEGWLEAVATASADADDQRKLSGFGSYLPTHLDVDQEHGETILAALGGDTPENKATARRVVDLVRFGYQALTGPEALSPDWQARLLNDVLSAIRAGEHRADFWPADAFDRLWAVWLKHKDKPVAREALTAVQKSGRVPFHSILHAAITYSKGQLARSDYQERFVPRLAEWLRDDGFEAPFNGRTGTAIPSINPNDRYRELMARTSRSKTRAAI